MLDLLDVYALDNVTANDPLKVVANDGTIIWEKTFWFVVYAIDWQGNVLSGDNYNYNLIVNSTNQPLQTSMTYNENDITEGVEIRRYNEDDLTFKVVFPNDGTWTNAQVRISTSLPTGSASGYTKLQDSISSLMGDKVYFALSKRLFNITINSVASDGSLNVTISRQTTQSSSSTSFITLVLTGNYQFTDSSGNEWIGQYSQNVLFYDNVTSITNTISPLDAAPGNYDTVPTPSNVYYYDVSIGAVENADNWPFLASADGYR